MKRKNFENIGKVAIDEICLSDTEIGLYIPIEEMSGNIRKQYEICEKCFNEAINKAYPDINIADYTVYSEITLNLNIDGWGEVNYSVKIIFWIEDENGHEIHAERSDPFEIEVNDEDNTYLKKMVLIKLVDSFF